ncbi:MAG: hypothetical protein HOI95_00430 [Chromatiales bacterium]|nr:hypothetical protein [Chromatiales bacterium]
MSISEARETDGLRLILLRRMPSPWGQAARCLFEVKNIAFTKVERRADDGPNALLDWTRQTSFPAAMYNDERPRTGWEEILWLAERLAPEPSLVPNAGEDRVRMFGLARELMGELGLVWCFRLFAMSGRLKPSAAHPDAAAADFAAKYHSGADLVSFAHERMLNVLRLLDSELEAQLARGRSYFFGVALSALDIYWATAANVLAPLPQDQLPLSERARPIFTTMDTALLQALTPRLLAHRDRVYADHLRLPVEL